MQNTYKTPMSLGKEIGVTLCFFGVCSLLASFGTGCTYSAHQIEANRPGMGSVVGTTIDAYFDGLNDMGIDVPNNNGITPGMGSVVGTTIDAYFDGLNDTNTAVLPL